MFPLGFILYGILHLLNLTDYISFSTLGNFSTVISSKIFLLSFLFLFFFWDPYYSNIGVLDIIPEEEKKKGYEKIFEEIIVENFPKMEKKIVNQI